MKLNEKVIELISVFNSSKSDSLLRKLKKTVFSQKIKSRFIHRLIS